MAQSGAAAGRRVSGTAFVGSFAESADQGVILLRGDVDAATVSRLRIHIGDFLDGPTRFITIDARAAGHYDSTLLDLMIRTQRRLGRRKGMLRILGLHPALLVGAVPDPPPDPSAEPSGAPATDGGTTGSTPVVPQTGSVPQAAP
jgi:anti-anti-sigma regulatory factor